MENLGREASRDVCYKLQGGIGKVLCAGSQERQELSPGLEGLEAAAAVGACTAPQQGQDC